MQCRSFLLVLFPYCRVTVTAANNEQGFGAVTTAMGTTQSIGEWPVCYCLLTYLSFSCISLQILAEPQRIFEQPIFDDVNIDSVVLMWEFPGGTVDNYIVQYVLALDGFGSDSIRSIFVVGAETSVVIGNLLPGSNYEFRVATVNDRGISAFSQLNTFTTLCESYTYSVYTAKSPSSCMYVMLLQYLTLQSSPVAVAILFKRGLQSS